MLSNISYILWFVTTLFIILTGIYFLLYSSKNIKRTRISKSNIKTLNVSLASRIGVGSISGVAIAIIVGGKGTILWIWLSSLLLPIIIYLETKVGILFRIKKEDSYISGPQVYIKEVLNNNRLSIVYSILILFTYLFAFILIQSNTIIKTFELNIIDNKIIITFILSIIVFISIRKGINSISKIVNYLVPIMGIIYIVIGIIIILSNLSLIPIIIKEIIKSSLEVKSIFTIPLVIGFQRSIFSNETGMGSTSMIVALSNSNDYNKESSIQIYGMYFITLVVTTISAILVLTTNYEIIDINNINGIEIINYAFNYHFGYIGNYLSLIIITLFSFSTIITCYYYGETCITYLFNKKISFIKIIVIIIILISTYIEPSNIWAIVDILCACTTIINLYSLIKIRKRLKE